MSVVESYIPSILALTDSAVEKVRSLKIEEQMISLNSEFMLQEEDAQVSSMVFHLTKNLRLKTTPLWKS